MEAGRTAKRVRTSLFFSNPEENEQVLQRTPEKVTEPVVGKHIRIRRALFVDNSGVNGGSLQSETHIESTELKGQTHEVLQLKFQNYQETERSKIEHVIRRLTEESNLTGNGRRQHILPTVSGTQSDIHYVTPETVSTVVRNEYADKLQYTVIDCRYPYEYNGGHIEGALNIHTEVGMKEYLLRSRDNSDPSNAFSVLIFHCEFSCERGPKLCRFLRNEDRKLNKENYPALQYPEIYVMSGGYKAFFHSYEMLCNPLDYVPMIHPDHVRDLRHFRTTSTTSGHVFKRKRSSQHCLRF